MKIGFIGLGAMGVPMATRLAGAGHAVTAFDLRAEAVARVTQAGCRGAASAADAARGAELLWLMVLSGDQAGSVLFDAGAAAALPAGAVVVAGCTQAPAAAQALSKRLAAMGLAMLDAPVSGGVGGAEKGTLAIMCSGPEAALDKARPALLAAGSNLFDIGREPGMGSTVKMINQLLCGVHIAVAAEALNVAERAGVPLDMVLKVIGVSAGHSWMFGDRAPRMTMADPPVRSAVDVFVKDLGIVLGQGTQMRQALPLASAAMQMFLGASGLGHGQADDSQVIRAYRALNGVPPAR